jgi:hypothetical protein
MDRDIIDSIFEDDELPFGMKQEEWDELPYKAQDHLWDGWRAKQRLTELNPRTGEPFTTKDAKLKLIEAIAANQSAVYEAHLHRLEEMMKDPGTYIAQLSRLREDPEQPLSAE